MDFFFKLECLNPSNYTELLNFYLILAYMKLLINFMVYLRENICEYVYASVATFIIK